MRPCRNAWMACVLPDDPMDDAVYVLVFRDSCCSFVFEDTGSVYEVSDHGFFGIRNLPTCSGSWSVLYSVLYCGKQYGAGSGKRAFVFEDRICDRAWDYFCSIYP